MYILNNKKMTVSTIKSKKRLEEITKMVRKLDAKQQETLLSELKKQELLKEAERLEGTVKPNNVTMHDIVKIVRKVRKKRYAEKR